MPRKVKSKVANNGAVAVVTESAKSRRLPSDGTPSKGKQYCTLCWGESYEGTKKLDGMPLFKCRDCSTVYHYECYRNVSIFALELQAQAKCWEPITDAEKNDGQTIYSYICIACASVGKSVVGRTKRGKKHTLEVATRPYECCLCNVASPDLPLPMHPVYDRNHGRQLILEGGGGASSSSSSGTGLRLAWCHTLCARVVGSTAATRGCVYSCDDLGKYGGFEGDDDDRSIGSEIVNARSEARTKREYGIHHFCIVQQASWPVYLKAIKNAKKFKCSDCGLDDTKANVFRIPVTVCCHDCLCQCVHVHAHVHFTNVL